MKIVIDKAVNRGHAQHGWLSTFHSFSFADYYNPEKMGFGALRVLNDDTMLPGEGFGSHPHQNMEIITIPLKGRLRHGDSLTHEQVLTKGDIQVMSAGVGLYHSEMNDSIIDEVSFLQIWIYPNKENRHPHYSSHSIRDLIAENKISTFIMPNSDICIGQEAWISWGQYTLTQFDEYKFKGEKSCLYIFVIEGSITIAENMLSRRDGIGIWETKEVLFEAMPNTEILLIETPIK